MKFARLEITLQFGSYVLKKKKIPLLHQMMAISKILKGGSIYPFFYFKLE